MSYLMRVRMPDAPGSLGLLAVALGNVGANIIGVDIVGHDADGVVVDDIIVQLPSQHLPDALITASQEIAGVYVDSIRPYSGTVDRRGQVQMLAAVASRRHDVNQALDIMMDGLPKSMTAGWAIVLRSEPTTTRVAASAAAPADNGKVLDSAPVTETRVLNPEREEWIPENWTVMDSSLAATPIKGTDLLLVIGRPGGPDFLLSELEGLEQLSTIVGAFFN
ncbi:amino acid-binding ACT domain protein [Corynebacterium dentalis]|uniref:amino acid-binding ACT domain protein n=1 Tax=Corynebacterium dentalis TaxID=2014528 RepID=UPI002896C4DF|nr:amino acid-binding ACT domain protein [Corynebacterium dentalis]